MTTQALGALPVRTVRDARLAGLAGIVAPYLAVLAWSLPVSAVWEAGWRVAAFVDPAASRPAGYLAGSLRQPVLLLLIASSALGFRFGARR